MIRTFNKNSYYLEELDNDSIDALITDPPYGISYQDHYWDKDLPDCVVWESSFKKLKPGAFGLVFSSVRLMHRLMVNLEDSGFLIKDVLFWSYLNGMPKSRNVGLLIDNELNVVSEQVGEYKYTQRYKKNRFDGGYKVDKNINLLLLLIQKPLEQRLNIAQNIIKYRVGALNFEDIRIPYEEGEKKVGHNPHLRGRIPSNILRTQEFYNGYDKFFVVPKVRQKRMILISIQL